MFCICFANRWMFSISWKLLPRSLIFLTELGPAILLINWHKTTPFFNTSSNLEILIIWPFLFWWFSISFVHGWSVGRFVPRTAWIQSKTSDSCCGLRFPATIYEVSRWVERKCGINKEGVNYTGMMMMRDVGMRWDSMQLLRETSVNASYVVYVTVCGGKKWKYHAI